MTRSRFFILAGSVLALALGVFAWQQARNREVFSAELVDEAQESREISTTGNQELAGDWPQWRGPARDGQVATSVAKALIADWPNGVAWEFAIGEGYSSPIVSDDRIWAMGRRDDLEILSCLNRASGAVVWEQSWPCAFKNDFGNGPRATPVLANGHVVTLGAQGDLRVVNAATGAPVWNIAFKEGLGHKTPQWGVSGSPLVIDGLVVAQPGAPAGLVAWELASGKEVWRTGELANDPSGYSSPMVAHFPGGTQIVALSAKRLAGINPATGAMLWDIPWETDFEVNAATPLVWSASSDNGEFRYVFVSSGYGKGCALFRVNSANGSWNVQQVYHARAMRSHFGTPVRLGDHIYGFDEQMLVCLDWRTGKAVWKQRGYGKGTLIAFEGHLAVLGDHGLLALIKANPEKCEEVRRLELFTPNGPANGRCWTAPVASRDGLLVRDEARMFMVKKNMPANTPGAGQ